jgi:3-hydroxybutyryl-CoA dehydrogenase
VNIDSVAVLGGGTMGGGIAGHLARAGLEVKLADASAELAERAREGLLERTRGHVDAGLLDADALARTEGVRAVADVEAAVEGVDLIVEAVPEDPDLKAQILRRASTAEGAVIATNTSSLPIAGLADAVAAPERFLGVHWFNPPEWTPGVEVIAGPDTRRETVERMLAFLRAIDKQPAEVADRAGFVSNRLQMALLREALAIVAEGQTTREDLDVIVRSTFGFRLPFYGPFQIADMAGLDTYVSVYETLERDVGPEFAPPSELREHVVAGRLGAKSGEGFAAYSDDERARLLLERDRRYAALSKLLEEIEGLRALAEPG